MKGFILKVGRFFIDFGTFIQLLLILVLSIIAGAGISGISDSAEIGFWSGIVIFILLFVMFILGNYLFYLFIGMHDSQESIAKSLKIIANSYNQTITVNDSQEQEKLICPNCNAEYSKGNKFCEECGTKLD